MSSWLFSGRAWKGRSYWKYMDTTVGRKPDLYYDPDIICRQSVSQNTLNV